LKTTWILARFEDNPAGERTPPAFAETLVERLDKGGSNASLIDPLDAWFRPEDGVPAFRHEAGPFPDPTAVVPLLDPFRPDVDLLFLQCPPLNRTRVLNALKALDLFRDPMTPAAALLRAGVDALPVYRLRRPHPVDAVIAELGVPIEARIPLDGGRWGRTRFEDKGSLRAVLDLLWREDAPAYIASAPENPDTERWVSVVGGRVVGAEAPVAAEAAGVLGLDLCAVRLREEGAKTRIVEVAPFPALPETAPTEEVLDAIAALVIEV